MFKALEPLQEVNVCQRKIKARPGDQRMGSAGVFPMTNFYTGVQQLPVQPPGLVRLLWQGYQKDI